MRILVSEYVSGGGWPEEELPSSLWAEGRAMLWAVASDLARLPHVQVSCTWDERFGVAPDFAAAKVQVLSVKGSAEEAQALSEWSFAASVTDAALVIAPEFDGILESRCERFRAFGIRVFNADAAALRTTADKWQTYLLCSEHGIPTIPTVLATRASQPDRFPLVAKLRDGAGSLQMELLDSPGEWRRFRDRPDLDRFLLQPFLAGRSCSVAGIVAEGTLRHLLPVGEQRFSAEERFSYQGGAIPVTDIPLAPVRELVERVVAVVPGLHGWTGFDLLLPYRDPWRPLLLEVNPRLTTSYVGYRAISRQPLAKWIVNPSDSEAPDFTGSVIFQADGQFRSESNINSELSQ